MKNRHFTFAYSCFDTAEALPIAEQRLLQAAQRATQQAYAPYSNFWVGAAAYIEGEMYVGNNQENAAYPSGMCAERTLMYWLSANFPSCAVEALAIVATHAHSDTPLPITPCGGCRQVLSEYERRQGTPLRLIFMGEDQKIWVIPSASSLLPFAFSENNLR